MPTPKTTWARAKIARYQRVRRKPMESLLMTVFSRLPIGTNHVSHSAHRMNQLEPAGRIHFVAQQAHECVERILLDVAVKTPDRFNERSPRHHLARAVHEPLQQI